LHIQITEQIKLSPLLVTDAVEILNLVNGNRVNLDKFLYWVKEVNCLKSAQHYLSDRINSGISGARWFKIYFKDRVSGIFAIKSVCPDSFIAELGYWLASAAQGHGVIRKVIQKLPEILHGSGAKVIEFRCLEQNYASINIALKSGATLVATIADYIFTDQTKQKLHIYRMPL
tara:strand:+ start:3273 stop:3791 length:519 start_codon:yes stop_codon:yes gene_type:complete